MAINNNKKIPPIGIEDFAEMQSQNYYYIDKTLFIKELFDTLAKVNVFLRPRRFGKTLALSTLKYFFEDTGDEARNAANRGLFTGTKIMREDTHYSEKMTKYNVISLTLKSAKQPTLREALYELKSAIAAELRRHRALVAGALDESSEEKYQFLLSFDSLKFDHEDWNTSILFLCECLFTATGKRTIILIDEYDVPLENAYFRGFYDDIIGFLRSIFESSLKTNTYLEFAVITGCLRVSRESLFTGLNNLRMISVLNNTFGEYFGFTQSEVDEMLDYYGLRARRGDVRDWYDGYMIGGADVYNPWSVINTPDHLRGNPDDYMTPHWVNTSSNEIIRTLVDRADESVKGEIEDLIAGGVIEKPVREDVTYADMLDRGDNLWNFMYFTGYLTKAGARRLEGVSNILPMRIPNLEVRYIYKDIIMAWLEKRFESKDLAPFYRAILDGDATSAEDALCDALIGTISFYDYKESYYHGFLAGMLRGIGGYAARSNRESVAGRSDIILMPNRSRNPVIIIEIKVAEKATDLYKMCEAALQQIEGRGYGADARAEGYTSFLHYGVAFFKKEAAVCCRRAAEARGS